MNSITSFWKSLGTAGKAVVIAIGVVLVFIIYNYFKNSGAGTNNTNVGNQPAYFLIRNYEGEGGHTGFKPPPPGGQTPVPQPAPGPPAPAPGPSGPLIPPGQWPKGVPWQFGQTINWKGITYTIGPGGNNRIWGVPGTGWNLNDWNRVPIGPGGKVLLYQG